MTPDNAQAEIIRRQGILTDCKVCDRTQVFLVVTHLPGGKINSYAETFDAAVDIIREESAPTELFFYTNNCLFELVAAA
jgi:hypothetical protein